MTTPKTASKKLLKLALRAGLRDIIRLTDPEDSPVEAEQRAAHTALERAIRRDCKFPLIDDLERLEKTVLAAVPPEYRKALEAALGVYHNEMIQQLVVAQDAGYALGITVGQALTPWGAELAGLR